MFFGKKRKVEVLAQWGGHDRRLPYWQIVWQRFRKNKMALWAYRGVVCLLVIALLSPLLSNDKPIYAKIQGEHHFPIVKEMLVQMGLSRWSKDLVHTDWTNRSYEYVLWALIPYDANYIDRANAGKSPFETQEVRSHRFRHWLGTDELGRDLAAGMIQGTRISLSIGVFTMLIACVIGLLLGGVAGYFGDSKLKMSWLRILLNVLAMVLSFYYLFMVRTYLLSEREYLVLEWVKRFALVFLLFAFANILSSPLERLFTFFQKRYRVAIDMVVMRLIESMHTIPGLFMILALLPLFSSKSNFNIMLILGLISWPSIAQFVRGEMLRIRRLPYIEAAEGMGYGSWRIIMRHALPNALTPVLIVVSFGVAGAILAESALSFLGLGSGEVSWGSLLSKGRNHFSYWWLTVFPGLAIFLTVTFFNLIGDGLSDALK